MIIILCQTFVYKYNIHNEAYLCQSFNHWKLSVSDLSFAINISLSPFSFFRFVSQLDGMFTFLEINKKVFEDILGSNLLTVKLFKKIQLKHLQQMWYIATQEDQV